MKEKNVFLLINQINFFIALICQLEKFSYIYLINDVTIKLKNVLCYFVKQH